MENVKDITGDWPVIHVCTVCHNVRTMRGSGVCLDCEDEGRTSEVDMYDEPKAIAEIRALSFDAKSHLQHVYRNGLQSASGLIEEGQPEAACAAIQAISSELRGLGL